MKIDDSYRLPAEFEQHAGTYLFWPVRSDNWRNGASLAQSNILSLAKLLSQQETVKLGFATRPSEAMVEQLGPKIRTLQIAYNDIWVRDTGPTVVVNRSGSAIGVDWKFNSWGGLFEDYAEDDAVAEKISHLEGYSTIKAPIVLEGGAIATDGARTILVTEESVIANNRNPGLTRADATGIFKKFLGADNVIWLPRGLANDESGGHVDNVCVFANARTILVADTADRDHPSFERVREIRDVLKHASNVLGQVFDQVPLPLPPPTFITVEEAKGFAPARGTIQREAGTQLAPSYVNMYLANGSVVVPTFGEDTDEIALEAVRKVFSDRVVTPFPSRELLLGGGAVHCVTRDIPVSG